LGAALPMVRVFIHSGENALGLGSMPIELASQAVDRVGNYWPLASPFVGALGSFLSGSTTFSNLMFSLLQYDVAVETGIAPALMLGLQTAGACAGNMVSVLNVVAAAAVAGLSGKEGTIMRLTLAPMLGLCALAGAVGLA